MATKFMAQVKDKILIPFAIPDIEIVSGYKDNQILNLTAAGTRKPRSLKQLGAYWRACKLASDNSNSPEFATPQLVDWRLRNALRFYDFDKTYVKGNHVNFKVRSICYEELEHIEATNYIGRALDSISKGLDIPMEILVRETL